jgi:prepilin peptidase CpaA
MPPVPFFPDPAFAWTFYAVLVALLTVALYTDLHEARVPNALSVAMLALGLLFNVVRGAFQGVGDKGLWTLSSGNAWLGAADGLLFSLAGFGVGFGLLFVMWSLRTCAGGDVKLMAALGAWVGPVLFIFVWFTSSALLLVITIGRMLVGGLSPSAVRARLKSVPVTAKREAKLRSGLSGRILMTYAAPVAVTTAALLLWFYRVDLNLAAPKGPPQSKVQTDGE